MVILNDFEVALEPIKKDSYYVQFTAGLAFGVSFFAGVIYVSYGYVYFGILCCILQLVSWYLLIVSGVLAGD